MHAAELSEHFVSTMPLQKHFEHLKIRLDAIKLATNNFANDQCIGKGGFGQVYKGELVLSKGQTVVAIKRLDRAFGQGNPEFWKEVILLSLYKHENIVSLLGFCDECDEQVLVYEYMSKKSLDLYLNNNDITWIQRLKICIGAARGLAYLHDPGITQQRVLHRDIKSSNILLDENWNARIGDFGLSKFGPANQQYTFTISNAVGTIGYCDPRYAETGMLTKESDVYSFGVVLFEVLCGRLSIENNNARRRSLAGLARECYEQKRVNEIIHVSIKDEIKHESLEEFTTIAYQCLSIEPDERPLMAKVMRTLEIALRYQLKTGMTAATNIDLERYMGRWYEIASTMPTLSMNSPRATYKLNRNGSMLVTREYWSSGKHNFNIWTAHKSDLKSHEPKCRLRLKFKSWGPRFLPVILVEDEHQVLYLDDEYTYALIGNASRKYLMIQSRLPHVNEQTYRYLVEKAAEKGYDVRKLKKTFQEDPPPEPEEEPEDNKWVQRVISLFGT